MRTNPRAAMLALSFVLASCGGGGGGGGGAASPGTPSAATLAISETNAKPLSANALDNAQNMSATRGPAGLPTGVQVEAGSAVTGPQWLAEAARLAATSLAAGSLPVAVTVNETVQCPSGGSLTISGHVASASGALVAGDSIGFTASNCVTSASGTPMTMNGQMTMTVTSGSLTGVPPFHAILNLRMTNMAVQFGGLASTANGDATLDWRADSSSSQAITVAGTSMSTRETVNGATHTNTMRNYTQAVTVNGTTMTSQLTATVETDAAALGAGTVSYSVTTPTPVVWTAGSAAPTAGAVKAVGANGSQLLATVNAGGSVTIQVDANGDGTFEKTVTTTVAELTALR